MHIEWEYKLSGYNICLVTEESKDIIEDDILIDLDENELNDHMVSSIVNDLNILIESNIRLKDGNSTT